MIGRRRPKRLWMRSDQAPTSGGTVIARNPPTPRATPMPVFCRSFWGTTSSTWDWRRTVVSGIHRKLLPNQKALSAACLRLLNPVAVLVGMAAAAVATPEGYC